MCYRVKHHLIIIVKVNTVTMILFPTASESSGMTEGFDEFMILEELIRLNARVCSILRKAENLMDPLSTSRCIYPTTLPTFFRIMVCISCNSINAGTITCIDLSRYLEPRSLKLANRERLAASTASFDVRIIKHKSCT